MRPEIPILLSKLKDIDPSTTIAVTIDTPRVLIDTCDHSQLDAIIARSDDGRRDDKFLGSEHFG